MNKRKRWLFALILLPLALATPLYSAASWRPHVLGVHPFFVGGKSANSVSQLMISPDGKRLLTYALGDTDPRGLAMWDIESKTLLWKRTQTGGLNEFALCFSPDSQTLVVTRSPAPKAGGSYKPLQLELLDCASGRLTGTSAIHGASWIESAAFAPDNRSLTVVVNGGIVVKDVAANRKTADINLLVQHKQGVHNIALSRDGQSFAYCFPVVNAGERSVASYNAELRDIRNRLRWKVSASGTMGFDFSPDSARVLVNESPLQIGVRETKKGRLLWQNSLGSTIYYSWVWMADSSAIVVDTGREYQVLDAQTGQLILSIKHGDCGQFVVAPDGNQIYSIDAKGQIMRQRLR